MNEILYRLKRYPRAIKEIIKGETNLVHIRCGERVSFLDVTEGYYAQCPECFEDVFSFEVEREGY